MPFCTNCGSSYEIGTQKCTKCGENLPRLNSLRKENISTDIFKKKNKTDDLKKTPAAGISKRLTAGGIDLFVGIAVMFFIVRIVLYRFLMRRAIIKGILASLIIYALSAAYFLLRDSLKGKSLGKLICSLTVVNLERNRPADIADSILRNCMFAIIVIPIIGWIIFGILSIFIIVQISMGKEQRVGDKFAKTKVIEDRYIENIYFR